MYHTCIYFFVGQQPQPKKSSKKKVGCFVVLCLINSANDCFRLHRQKTKRPQSPLMSQMLSMVFFEIVHSPIPFVFTSLLGDSQAKRPKREASMVIIWFTQAINMRLTITKKKDDKRELPKDNVKEVCYCCLKLNRSSNETLKDVKSKEIENKKKKPIG